MLRFHQNERGLRSFQIYYRHSTKRILSTLTRNHYEILGVASSASRADIKKAYIEKAKKCHPDLFPDNEEKTKEFQDLQESYSVLNDTKKRAAFSQSQQQTAGAGVPGGFRHPYSEFNGGIPRQSNANRSGMNDPFHEMMKDFHRRQYSKPFTKEELSDTQEKKKRWERIVISFLLFYFVAVIVAGNFRFESNESRMRRLEYVSEMETGREGSKIIHEYRERIRQRHQARIHKDAVENLPNEQNQTKIDPSNQKSDTSDSGSET